MVIKNSESNVTASVDKKGVFLISPIYNTILVIIIFLLEAKKNITFAKWLLQKYESWY